LEKKLPTEFFDESLRLRLVQLNTLPDVEHTSGRTRIVTDSVRKRNKKEVLAIYKKKMMYIVPCPKKVDVTHALSEAHWQHSAIESFLGVYDWQYKYLFVCLYANHLP
jgi:hypothetical protein